MDNDHKAGGEPNPQGRPDQEPIEPRTLGEWIRANQTFSVEDLRQLAVRSGYAANEFDIAWRTFREEREAAATASLPVTSSSNDAEY